MSRCMPTGRRWWLGRKQSDVDHDESGSLMQFETRPIPEGINVSDENPLVDFIWMLLTVGFIIGVLVVVLSVSAGWLAKNILRGLARLVV